MTIEGQRDRHLALSLSKGGSGLHACFDKLSTRLLVWLGKVASPVARIGPFTRRYDILHIGARWSDGTGPASAVIIPVPACPRTFFQGPRAQRP